MIPTLILLLVRRYRQRHPEAVLFKAATLRLAARLGVVLVLLGLTAYAMAQDRVLHYTIRRNGDQVGHLILQESKVNNRITYKLQSTVRTRFLATVTLKTTEEAIYENGSLTYLRFYQTLNNSERVNTIIQATNNGYVLVGEKARKPVSKAPITYNLVCLYTVEPLHWKHLFADKFKQFIPIETLAPHHYKITFPDGGYNEYLYQDGICVKAKLVTTWFSADMVLNR